MKQTLFNELLCFCSVFYVKNQTNLMLSPRSGILRKMKNTRVSLGWTKRTVTVLNWKQVEHSLWNRWVQVSGRLVPAWWEDRLGSGPMGRSLVCRNESIAPVFCGLLGLKQPDPWSKQLNYVNFFCKVLGSALEIWYGKSGFFSWTW